MLLWRVCMEKFLWAAYPVLRCSSSFTSGLALPWEWIFRTAQSHPEARVCNLVKILLFILWRDGCQFMLLKVGICRGGGCTVASSMLVFLFHEEVPFFFCMDVGLWGRWGRKKRSSASQSFSKGSAELSLLCHLTQKWLQSSSCVARMCIDPSVPASVLSQAVSGT